MIAAVLILLLGAGLVAVFVKVKNDRFQEIVDSDLDYDLDPKLVEAALGPKGQNWDAAE